MARYMISLLEKGDSTLLGQHITMHPRLAGVTLGLFEGFVGDLRFVEHGGNMAGFSAQMTLIPSERIGFFVVNHMEGSQLRNSVSYALIDHLYPAARQQRFVVLQSPPDFEQRAAAYTGRYVPMTGCVSCQPRRAPFVLEVSAERNMLVVNKRHWIEVEPLVFVSDDGMGTIVFRTDDQGRVSQLFSGGSWSFERLKD